MSSSKVCRKVNEASGATSKILSDRGTQIQGVNAINVLTASGGRDLDRAVRLKCRPAPGLGALVSGHCSLYHHELSLPFRK